MIKLLAGDIRQFIIDGRAFSPQAGSSWNVELGGYDNEVSRTGNGNLFAKQATVPGKVENAAVHLDPSKGDFEFLKERKDSAKLFPFSISLAGGTVYSGEGIISGSTVFNTGDGLATVSIMGSDLQKL